MIHHIFMSDFIRLAFFFLVKASPKRKTNLITIKSKHSNSLYLKGFKIRQNELAPCSHAVALNMQCAND